MANKEIASTFYGGSSNKKKRSMTPLANGMIPEYACGPLMKPRYINPKIEEELIEFKIEIEEKWEASQMNREFVFPRK